MPTDKPDATNDAAYTLPSLWGSHEGPRTAAAWDARRQELVELFASEVYGRTPSGGGVGEVKVRSVDPAALGGLATCQQMTVTLAGPLGARTASLLLYLPNTASAPVGCFVGLNFKGNHATSADPAIDISDGWMPAPSARGEAARRWPAGLVIERGYALATMHYSELEPDAPGRAAEGVRGLFETEQALQARAGDAWGAVGAWAWGLSRILDVLIATPGIDGKRIIVHGHSRLGKAALWSAVQDRRFAGVVSNDSGCAGASLTRHVSGETIAMITRDFPHWFAPNLAGYGDRIDALPVDQHQLLAAMAPRPVHVASATLDAHADPRGEFLSTLHASPVFSLHGHDGTLADPAIPPGEDVPFDTARRVAMPLVGTRIGGRLSYHLREGGHDVLAEDWAHFLDFADEQLPGQ